MNRVRPRRFVYALALLAVAACNSTDNVVEPTGNAELDSYFAAAGAELAEAPLALRAGEAVLRVFPQSLTCPPTFDLGGGVRGTCVSATTTSYGYYGDIYTNVTQTLSTTAGSPPAPELAFDLRVDPHDDASGDFFLEVWSANANLPNGNGSWSLQGHVFATDTGFVTDSRLELTVAHATWMVRRGYIERNSGGSPPLQMRVDGATGEGTVYFNGLLVASVSVSGGCVAVDFVRESIQDVNTCLW